MDTPLVKLENVALTYQSPDTETEVLKDLNLDVNDAELVGVVGPSGCGKTTILSLVCGLIKPSSGKITVCGASPENAKEKLGYMLQKDELFNWRTIYENVTLGLEIKKRKNAETKRLADELLAKYKLDDFREFHPSQLSGGMRQRVALIRTLVTSPQVLLLDEPFSALDFQTRLNVVEDVRKIIKAEKITTLFVTHDISEAISMCDRIAVLGNRPANVKVMLEMDALKGLNSFQRREHPKFGELFDTIWKNLQYNTE